MADYNYIDTTGTVVPDTADTQAAVEQEYKDVFGQDLIVTPNTPQGVLIAAETTARQAVARNNAALANQINPNLAGGVFLDAIWSLTGGQRIAATRSVIPNVTLAGVPGTLIPAGSRAQTVAGDFFASAADATLDAFGSATVNFIAEELGPVPAAVAALNIVVSAVLGWETVTNATAATPGELEESDVAARLRRRNTLALQGVALPEAIISGVADTEGVKSLQFRENPTGGPLVIDTIPMVAHSIYVCVDGGTDADVAMAILRKKSLGADMNGAVIVNVTDPASGQLYEIKFDRPTPIPVLARITVRNQHATSNPVTLVQDAVVTYASGEMDGEPGFVVGGSVSPFELGGAVNRVQPGLYVQLVELSLDGVTWDTVQIPILINEIATITAPSVTVIVL